MQKPFLFVALDDLSQKEEETLKTAEQLSGIKGNFGFKVNLDYLLNPKKSLKTAVKSIQQFGRPVFTDLKMWNGTRTMASVIENLVALEVDFLNVYALADNLLPKAIQITEGSNTKVLVLTVLTHFDETYCQRWFRRSLQETVRFSAEVALERGGHGIILPGTALDIVQDLKTTKAVPGVRPKWFKDTRHKEEIEPRMAVEKNADILVCGSPITKAADKIEALKRILEEMKI